MVVLDLKFLHPEFLTSSLSRLLKISLIVVLYLRARRFNENSIWPFVLRSVSGSVFFTLKQFGLLTFCHNEEWTQ